MSCVLHSSISLDYSFPSRKQFDDIRKGLLLPRDALILQNLTLERMPQAKDPVRVTQPIQKTFSSQRQDDPLEALYEKSKNVIDSYTESMQNALSSNTATATGGKKLLSTKKIEDSFVEKTQGYHFSPSAGKTLYFSPKFTKKASTTLPQSTPDTKDATRRKLDFSTQGQSKMRKVDILQLSGKKTAASGPVQIYEDSQPETEEDNLACHAGHILRMAMDTTLLGSSYNSSMNSSFGFNDSILGSKRNIHDLEGEESITRSLKREHNLNTNKATKVEISAEDLNNAIYADC